MLYDLIKKLKELVASLQKKYPPPVVNPVNIEPPAPTPVSELRNWALGIQDGEGYPNCAGAQYNNPGDIKYTTYARDIGATGRSTAGWAIFPSYEAGLSAVMQLCRDAATDKLQAYRSTMTLWDFVKVYADPVNDLAHDNYCDKILNRLTTKVDKNVQISLLK